MRSESTGPRSHKLAKLAWITAPVLVSLTAIAATPFVATSQVARLSLAYLFPANSPSVGSVTLSTDGTVVIRGLVLHDTGALADHPLIAAGVVDATFGWRELFARKVRQIRAADVHIYARSSASSQLSLLDLFFERTPKPKRATIPMWIDAVDVDGIIHREPVAGFVTSTSDWPLKVRMTMSGDRMNPSRRLSVRVGEERRPADFGLNAEVETQPMAWGTRVVVRRLATWRGSLAIEADAIRKFGAKLPPELIGPIDTSVANLSASGQLDVPGPSQKPPNGERLSGSLAFSGLRVHALGKSPMMLSLDGLSGAIKVDTSIPPGPTTSITVEQLETRNAQASLAADTLRQYVAKLPAELKGPVETRLADLSASGTLNQSGPDTAKRLTGRLAFAGVQVHAPGKSSMMFNLDDLSGAVSVDTPLPLGAATTIAFDQVKLINTRVSVDADTIRNYTTRLPADLHGNFDSNLASLSVSGGVNSRSDAMWFQGEITLRDFSLHSPRGGKHAIALDKFAIAGSVETPLNKWTPAAVRVQGGVTRWASLSYGDNAVTNLDASWRIDNQMLTTDHVVAQIFDGKISGAPSMNLVTHQVPRCDLQIESINVHNALANASPEHLDAVGIASGSMHLELSKQSDLSGDLDLTFDGPGTLRIGQIDEVKQMLVGNFGLDMANLAMRDLERYPFKEGTMHLASVGESSELKIKFVRQPKSAADLTSPHKEIINGQEMMVRSMVVPTIDMTIPITGQSLAEILSLVSGVHPMIEAAKQRSGN